MSGQSGVRSGARVRRLDRGAPGRVAVAGGGPAGLEAARTLAEGGHSVTLFEAAAELGGLWRLMTRIFGRAEFEKHLDWQISSVHAAGVKVRTGVGFVPVEHEPTDWDLVVVAAGARYEVPVMDHDHVLPPDSAIATPWATAYRVAVLGAPRFKWWRPSISARSGET
jgi:2,4-dienoyl-CoA reductase (NADPH2)